MSPILTRLARYAGLSRVAPEAKTSAVAPLIAMQYQRQPVWSPRDYAAFAREGFMQNPVVYRCVRMIAEAAASVPVDLFAGDTELPIIRCSICWLSPIRCNAGPTCPKQ